MSVLSEVRLGHSEMASMFHSTAIVGRGTNSGSRIRIQIQFPSGRHAMLRGLPNCRFTNDGSEVEKSVEAGALVCLPVVWMRMVHSMTPSPGPDGTIRRAR